MKKFTGYTATTAESLVMNAGAIFKNFFVGKDTYESAMADGKCLGATKGGGKFDAKPTFRDIPIDGVFGAVKGASVIDAWVVTMTTNVIEITPQTLTDTLATGTVTSLNDDYFKIQARKSVEIADYVENITWVGTLSGSDKPVIIQIYNALSNAGLSMSFTDKNEAVMAITFTAHSDYFGGSIDNNMAPFAIYYPKAMPFVVFDTVLDTATVVTGKGLIGATVSISGGTISANSTAVVASDGTFSITIDPQKSGTEITGNQTLNNKTSATAVVIVDANTSL